MMYLSRVCSRLERRAVMYFVLRARSSLHVVMLSLSSRALPLLSLSLLLRSPLALALASLLLLHRSDVISIDDEFGGGSPNGLEP